MVDLLGFKLGILRTSIITADGFYSAYTITLDDAKALIRAAINGPGIDSAVGHVSTAELLTVLLGVEIPVSRQRFEQQVGQRALVFKLNERLDISGTEMTADQLKSIGYTLKVMMRYK